MKRSKRLIASLIAGLAAAALTMWYGMSVQAEAEQERQEALAAYGGELVRVCVATRDIDAGETLDEGNVRIEEWVAGLVPDDAVTSVDEVLGKQVTSAVPRRAVLCPAYFQTRSGSLEIPDDLVAVSVAVDAAHAVGGSVEPGTEVDVYVSADGIADRLCRAQVIDTSARGDEAASSELSWATLAVEPDRVTEVLAASVRGTVFLVAPGEGVGESGEPPSEEAGGDGESSPDASAAAARDAGEEGQVAAGGQGTTEGRDGAVEQTAGAKLSVKGGALG